MRARIGGCIQNAGQAWLCDPSSRPYARHQGGQPFSQMHPMKIQFDSNQQYQLDAIQATVEIFDGQPLARGEYEIRFDAADGDMLTHFGLGNNLVLDESTMLANVQNPPIAAPNA